jgi:hypothetical protein
MPSGNEIADEPIERQGRGAADRGQYREAAGAVAKGVSQVHEKGR